MNSYHFLTVIRKTNHKGEVKCPFLLLAEGGFIWTLSMITLGKDEELNLEQYFLLINVECHFGELTSSWGTL